jgi:phosphoadenosine phosphosulfate reductase
MRRSCHEVSPETKPEPAVSTNEALQNSLHRSLNFLNVSRGTSHTEQNYRDPEQSPAGASTMTELLADDIVAHNRQLVTNYADALYDASAEDSLAWADEHVPGDIGVTMSMENTVLAELASCYVPRAGAATNQLDWVQILGRASGIGSGRIWAGIWSSHAASLEHLVMQIIGSTRDVFFDRAAILLLVSRAEFWDELLGILLGDGDAGFMVSVYVSDDAMI